MTIDCVLRLRKRPLCLIIIFSLIVGFPFLGCNGSSGGDDDDSDQTTWYRDADFDRYSDGTTRKADSRPFEYYLAAELIALSGDCNDDDATIHPDADEINCDGIDQNCDGINDCLPVWYKDTDGDGYSDGSSLISATQPIDYYAETDLTMISGDCNDLSSAFHPGVTEVCSDRLDNNCDADVDEGCFDDGAFDNFCSLGQGIPAAASYNPTNEFHPIRLLKLDSSRHPWNYILPIDWIPASIADTQLVACVGDDYEELIQTCSYNPSGTFRRYRHFVDITLRVARTGEIIDTVKVGGSLPETCPQVIFGSGESHGDPVTGLDALDEFVAHVEHTQRTLAGTEPWGVDFQGDDIWITDTSDNSIKKIDRTGSVLISFAAPGSSPRGIAFDGTDLWVVDSAEARIYQLTTGGTVSGSFDIPGTIGSSYAGICFDGSHLWVLEKTASFMYRLIQTSMDGNEISGLSLQPLDFLNPLGVVFDGTHFWISDDTLNDVLKIDSTGTVIETIELEHNSPRGLAFANGQIWVADADQATAFQIDPNADFFQYMESQTYWAESLAHDGTNLYLAYDYRYITNEPHPIYKLDQNGNILENLTGPEQGIEDMTVDGSHIWIAPRNTGFGSIYQYDLAGNFVSELSTPITFMDGLASVTPDFWILDAINDFIFRIDNGGDITDIVDPGLGNISNLTWTGNDLWTASGDTLYKIDPQSSRLVYFEVESINDPTGIAHDGTDLWLGLYDDLYRVDTDGTILQTITLSNLPGGAVAPSINALDFDGTHFWISDDGNHLVFEVDTDGAVVSSFAPMDTADTCEDVSGLAYDGASLWVACDDDDTIYEFAPNGDSLSGAIAYPSDFSVNGMGWDGTHLLVMTSPRLYKLDPGTGDIVAEIENTPGSWKKDMAHDGTYLWIAADRIYRYDESADLPEAIDVPGLNITGLTHDGTNLWVADAIDKTIHKLTEEGLELAAVDIPGYYWYRGITYNAGHFWINESQDGKLYQIDPDGKMQRSFDTPGNNSWDLSHDGTNLWTIDAENEMIYWLDEGGSVLDSFASPASSPRGMAYADGHLWVADQDTHHLFQIEPDGTVVSDTLLPVAEPRGLAYDGIHLWVGNDADDRIYRIDSSGDIIDFIPVPGTDLRGLTYDGTHIWVADDGQHRMIRINPTDWVAFP